MKWIGGLVLLVVAVATGGYLAGRHAATPGQGQQQLASKAAASNVATRRAPEEAAEARLVRASSLGPGDLPGAMTVNPEGAPRSPPLTGEAIEALQTSANALAEQVLPRRFDGVDAPDGEVAYAQYLRWSECGNTASIESMALRMARLSETNAMPAEDLELQASMLDILELMPEREGACDAVTDWEAKRQRFEWLDAAVRRRYPLAFLEFPEAGRADLLDLELREPGYLDRYRSTASTALILGVRSGSARGFLAHAKAILAEELVELDYAELLAYATAADEARRVLGVVASTGRVDGFEYDLSDLIKVAEAHLSVEDAREARSGGRDLCKRYCYGRD